MKVQLSEFVRLDESGVCTLEQLVESSGLSLVEVQDLIDSGVLAPVPAREPSAFPLRAIVTVKTARRLRDDFELDAHGLALAVQLLERISQLEAQLQAARTRHLL